MKRTPHYRFWSKVAQGPNGCWLWMGCKAGGYGQFRFDMKMVYAHRFAWEQIKGPLPAWQYKGMQLDHVCRQRSCVNPAHLELVTGRTNVLRGEGITAVHARQTHCIRGHLFSLDNTRITSIGGRRCRDCAKHGVRESRLRKKQK